MTDYKTLSETDLFNLLTKWRDAYYNVSPEISDDLFDQVEDYARTQFPGNPFFAKVGASPSGGAWPKVAHSIPMGSLNKAVCTKDDAGKLLPSTELATWHKNLNTCNPLICMDKLDGGSLSLCFKNLRLIQVLTRGDGNTGEDITRNAMLVQGMVKQLPAKRPDGSPTPNEVYVRGEIVVTRTDFKTHFPGESNPRNTANGCIKRQTGHEKCQYLTFMPYEILYGGAGNPQEPTKTAELKLLASMGFRTPRWSACTTLSAVEQEYQNYVGSVRESLNYEIDGLVLAVDDRVLRENLGDLNGRPRGSVAYKFPNAEAISTLRAIRWQVGNSGRITPVAEFDEVLLAGAKVKQANIHNISNIRDLTGGVGFHVGDLIKAVRRGDVIPHVEELITVNPNGELLATPTECPSCKALLIMDGEYLICRNEDCEAQAAGAVKRWVSKLNVLHVGETLIEALCDAGFIEDPADLYTLDPDKVAELDLSGRRVGASAEKAVKNLNAKKILPLHTVVGSLGIPLIGRSMAKTISDAGFNTLSKMLKAKISEIEAIPGMGETKARSFVEGFQKKTWLIAKLLANGIEIQDNQGILNGQSFCLTGFRSAELVDAIEKQGGTVKDGVSKGLTYLVALDASSTSGKAGKAKNYGIKVIDQDMAWAMVGSK